MYLLKVIVVCVVARCKDFTRSPCQLLRVPSNHVRGKIVARKGAKVGRGNQGTRTIAARTNKRMPRPRLQMTVSSILKENADLEGEKLSLRTK